MNPNVLLGGLLVGGLVIAGGAMFLNGDFSEPQVEAPYTQSESSAPKLAVKVPSGLGKLIALSPQSDPRDVTDPNQVVKREFYGYAIGTPAMLSSDGALHLTKDVLIGLPDGHYGLPSQARAVPTDAACAAPSVPAGADFMNVHVGGSKLHSPYKLYSDDVMARQLNAWVTRVRQRNKLPDAPPEAPEPTGMVNVAITQADGPVYLVLQAASEPIVWNLQTAQNIDIAQIVMVGHPGQTVATPKSMDDAPVHALAISEDCAPEPARAPAQHWGLFDGKTPQSSSLGDYEIAAVRRYQAYNRWFDDTFGRASEDGAVGAWQVSHVLIGPVPSGGEVSGLPYQPMADRTAHITPTDHLFFANDAGSREEEIARQIELATTAAGGDLAHLVLEPMEVTQ